MDISSINGSNLPAAAEKKNSIAVKPSFSAKTSDKSSLDALASMGRALVNFFKGSAAPALEMSDEKFIRLGREFEEKLKLLPENVQAEFLYTDFSKYNINFALRFIPDEKYYSSGEVLRNIKWIILDIKTPEQAEIAQRLMSSINASDSAEEKTAEIRHVLHLDFSEDEWKHISKLEDEKLAKLSKHAGVFKKAALEAAELSDEDYSKFLIFAQAGWNMRIAPDEIFAYIKGHPDEQELKKIDSVIKNFASAAVFKTFDEINKYSLLNEEEIKRFNETVQTQQAHEADLVLKIIKSEQYSKFLDLMKSGVLGYYALDAADFSLNQITAVKALKNLGVDDYDCIETAGQKGENEEELQDCITRAQELISQGVKGWDLKRSLKLSASEYSKQKELINLGIKDYELEKFYELDEEQYKTAIDLIKKYPIGPNAASLAVFPQDRLEKAAGLLGKGKRVEVFYTACAITRTAEFDDEQFERFISLWNAGADANTALRYAHDEAQAEKVKMLIKKGVYSFHLEDILKLDEIQQKRYIKLFESGIYSSDALKIAQLNDLAYQHYETAVSSGEESFNALKIAKYDDTAFDRYLELKKRGHSFYEIEKVIDLDSWKYERFIQLINDGINFYDAAEIAHMRGSAYEQCMNLINNKGIEPDAAVLLTHNSRVFQGEELPEPLIILAQKNLISGCWNDDTLLEFINSAIYNPYGEIDVQKSEKLQALLNQKGFSSFKSNTALSGIEFNMLLDLNKQYDSQIKNDELILPQVMLLSSRTSRFFNIKCEDIINLNKKIGIDKAAALSVSDTASAVRFADFCGIGGIEELTSSEKREFLKNLVSVNADLFEISEEMRKFFPILPKNQEEYCILLPAVVNSLGIGIEKLSDNEILQFNTNLKLTAEKLKNITDEEFKKLDISYSEHSGISCTDKRLETLLKEIIEVLPELKSTIGRKQHKTHAYDVFKHSLKVMQGVVKNPKYDKLNKSDKKLMLLASLLHDMSKKEGAADGSHADNSSFEASLIVKKFKLTKEEEIKLYTLIKHHEWLNYVNTSKSEEQLEKRRQSTAYDLRHDNLFDMSLIFTHADLKAVNDKFADLTLDENGNPHPKRIDFNGAVRSYSQAADYHAEKIKEYIEELKKSQPLLPVTSLPKADRINQAVSTVNSDRSTNIKGVYKDKDGLIIIKYNELENEDLEKIGFPKGSKVKGITTRTSAGEDVDTGNVKFFAHGLDFPNQLIKFDAFSLPDSDALLSVSYAERPESKYRFFRPQGILLNCDTKYIHGGGKTDSGSGCGKSIQDFKKRYIFGGERESDRTFVSDLIKETLNLNDEEYIKFEKANENKSMIEIEPEETREKLIKAFAGINSHVRHGKREYNEMYISNPKPPMAVFAYEMDYDKKISNPAEFLNSTQKDNISGSSVSERTAFLRQYALEHNIPFIVFGD